MIKKILWSALWLCSSLPAFSEEVCEGLVTYQVCWPETEFVVFSGVQNGAGIFTVDVDGINLSMNLGMIYASAEALQEDYLSQATFHEGTYEVIERDVTNSALTFTFSAVGAAHLNEPRRPNLGIPKIISILPVNGDFILAETFFPNPFQLAGNAVWNEDRLAIHEKFTSYIHPLSY
jgi:hypothetical protein